jgi:hypothetical protein
MNKLRAANEALDNGDALSEANLNLLLSYYDDLSQRLDALNAPEYRLVQRDVWRKRDMLRGFRQARDEHKKKG